jgi:hypothetical protein
MLAALRSEGPMIASAVLCAHVDGVLWDTEANEYIAAGDALSWARSMEAEIRNAL